MLLGEDEMQPRNRLALICCQCRLVNGQAPPGIKRLEDVGKWRCSGCGTMNGEETDNEKIVAKIKEQAIPQVDNMDTKTSKALEDDVRDNEVALNDGSHESDVTQYSEDAETGSSTAEKNKEDFSEPSPEPEVPKRRAGRPKGPGKKQG